jgi:hypothetical protein
MAAEDVRHLECGPHAGRSTRRRNHQVEAIQRARRVGDQGCRNLGIAGGRRQPGMTEQHLDDADVGACFEQVSGEAVPQGVYRHRLGQIGALRRDPAGLLQRGDADRRARFPAGKQPIARPRQPPVGAQDLQQLRRQHDIAVFTALALLDPD